MNKNSNFVNIKMDFSVSTLEDFVILHKLVKTTVKQVNTDVPEEDTCELADVIKVDLWETTEGRINGTEDDDWFSGIISVLLPERSATAFQFAFADSKADTDAIEVEDVRIDRLGPFLPVFELNDAAWGKFLVKFEADPTSFFDEEGEFDYNYQSLFA